MKYSRRMLPCLIAVFLICFPAWAQDQDTSDLLGGFEEAPGQDLLGGFDAVPEVLTETGTDQPNTFFDGRLRISGWAGASIAYDFAHDDPGPGVKDPAVWSRLRPEMFLQADADIYQSWRIRANGRFWHDFAFGLHGYDEYTPQFLDDYEDRYELWEAYLEGRIVRGLTLKTGRQIVAWGNSENLRVTDVLNPLDLREIGMTDIEDLRLPVAMTRLDYVRGRWSLTGLAIHEIRSDLNAVFGSPYSPAQNPLPPEDKPAGSLGDTGWGVALEGSLTGWDINLYWADYFSHEPYLAMTAEPVFAWPGIMVAPPRYALRYARLHMVGAAANVVLGDWLAKAEAARVAGFQVFRPAP